MAKSKSTMPKDCCVCCDRKSLFVKCHCDFEACRDCIERYILGENREPACMSCSATWDRRFIAKSFSSKFVTVTLKEHLENVYHERELGLVQSTQGDVAQYLAEKERKVQIALIDDAIQELQVRKARLQNRMYEKHAVVRATMRCPTTGCLGFMDAKCHCQVCGADACKRCRELVDGDGHECDPAILENVEALKRDTKPCPKCASLIFKIEGCFARDTPILMWDQSMKMSQDVQVGDVLIGDDGTPRNVVNICTGEDELFKVCQNNGHDYIVNSKHTLALKTVGSDDVLEIKVDDYIKLSETIQKTLCGFKSSNGINYSQQVVELDPYILGLWLGDGTHTLPIIASNDVEIQRYLLQWCVSNDAELVHDEAVKFRIRRKGKCNGKNASRNPIGQSTSETCKGCTYKKMEICDLVKEDARDTHPSKTNPFMDLLYKYNLVGNKHIPEAYMMNSREVRLAMLAGLIDSDGHVSNDGKRVSVGQVNKRLSDQIATLARSLGYIVNERIVGRKNVKCPGVEPRDYQDNHVVNISSSILSEIPTLLPRKKCKDSDTNKDYQKTAVTVTSIGRGVYYGFQVDSNHRFVAKDFTVLKNCDQMFCVECHTFFSWITLKVQVGGPRHNPHYFEYQTRAGNAPRNPGDVLCGRTLDRHLARRVPAYYSRLVQKLEHMRVVIMPRYEQGDVPGRNTIDRVQFILGNVTPEYFKRNVQKREKAARKNQEIHDILELFVQSTTDDLYKLANNRKPNEFEEETRALTAYCNTELEEVSKAYKCVKHRISAEFDFLK